MKNFGSTLALVGVGSMLINLTGREFYLLQWVDNWGQQVGMTIRLAMVIVGIAIFIAGIKHENSQMITMRADELV